MEQVPAPAAPEPEPAPPEPEPWEAESDPIRRRTLKEEAWFRTNFAEDGETIRFQHRRPFLIAEVLPAGREADTPDTVRLYARVLAGVLETVPRIFREGASVELPPLQSLGDERLRWIVFPSRERFDRWHRAMGRPVPGTAYFERGSDGLVVTHADDLDPRNIAWLAASQSIARWKRHFCEIDDDAMADAKGLPREPVTADDRRLQTAYAWLDRGLASLVAEESVRGGARSPSADGLAAFHEHAVARRARAQGRLWPLEDFLFQDGPGLRSLAGQRGGGEAIPSWEATHAAQSRLLVDTLLGGEGGRWREGFGALLRREIRGVTGRGYLLGAFGLPKRKDSPELKAWIAEVEKACLARLDATAPK